MSDTKTQIEGTVFTVESTTKRDDAVIKEIGPRLCTHLRKIFRLGEMLDPDHNQLVLATREMAEWIESSFVKSGESTLTLQMTADNFFINGQLMKLDNHQFARVVVLQEMLLKVQVNQVTFARGVGAGEVQSLCRSVLDVTRGKMASMELFVQPNLKLAFVATEDSSGMGLGDEFRKLVQVYAGLMIKSAVYFHQIRNHANPSTRNIKRMLQRMYDELEERADVLVGLINMKFFPSQDFIHAANTASLSMVLAHAVGLDRRDVVRCGLTAITQNIERYKQQDLFEDEDAEIELGADSHYQTNLTSVITLSEMGTSDLVSALRLVTSYEKGFPYNRPLPKHWYEEELRPHLLSRIIEIASHFDIWLYGLEGYEAMEPDLALQSLMSQMGSHYDPALSKLFINLLGIYPVGSIVELSTGQHAFVLRSPSLKTEGKLSHAHRPVVRLMDDSGRIVDLCEIDNQHIRVLRIVPREEQQARPTAMFLF